MAKFDYVHLCKFADKDLPDALLDAVLKEHQSCAGVAVLGAVDGYLGTFLQSEGTKTADVQTLLASHKDKNCFLSFGKFPKEFPEDNVQPFVALFDGEGNTTMGVFMSGNFEEKAKAGTDKSAAFQIYQRLVLPQILKAAKNHEDDAEKTFEEMASDPTTAELMKMFYKDAGAITMVCNADMITWGEGMQHPFDFGWVTNPCGYTEKKAEPEVPAKSKSSFSLGGFKKPAEAKTEDFPKGSPSVESLAAAKSSVSTVALPNDADELANNDEDFVWTSPPSAWTKDQKRKWYLTYNILDDKPVLPDGYKNCPKVKVRKSLISGAPTTSTVKDFKDIDKDKVVTSSNTQVTAESLPVISPKSKKYLVDVFLKKGHVQKTISDGKVIIDPKRIEQLEADWPTFVETGGMEDIRQTLTFTHEDRMDLLKNAPDALVVLLQDTQLALYKVLKEHNQLDLKIAAEPEVKPAAAPKKQLLSFKK